ncbi:NAD-dependent aldehyde dehydrogenase [Bernardetia litoralis DSM 6794]|uniref:Aldehyde dehydrogenase n=1 Tax=Bernardetia litoralis (strain ATCC 23117 / DSM 6794 / NBRC 15988 / NCIMB 1366 / Fx l1 / Sio-4) TaxID=880071 RepID=I4AHB7_BERLS|nr:aldehyde dehydrogenase family protein [Bernardetia litoralis]AFM03352.1 NAD-dependent aldehyde dehydrogenase [Bernardetia litoralis DSM 6794]
MSEIQAESVSLSDTETNFKTQIDEIFEAQQNNRWAVAKTTTKERIEKLKRLQDALHNYRSAFHHSLHQDFGKPEAETDLSEIYPTSNEIKHAISNLEKWMKDESVSTPVALLGSKSYIRYEAKGVCLVIAPWNYPVNLILIPLISAIAAGNCVILKPSEYTPNTNEIMAQLIKEVFTENEVAFVEGEVEVSKYLLEKPFDHIFFTGSTAVGKIVMKAAAENLTSVTLELGGKSPVIVDETANLKEAAKKIVWGKFLNAGQTCIAPDYVLVHEDIEHELIQQMLKYLSEFYGQTSGERLDSPDYARIINEKQYKSLVELIGKAKGQGAVVHTGGTVVAEQRYIAPTIMSEVPLDSEVMQQEIFGPIMPVIRFKYLNDALDLINKKDKPLALYLFSQDRKTIDTVLASTSSGGVCINDTVIHYFQHNLPFGGVNHSGIGKAHGIFGFKTFSNERAVLEQPTRFSAPQLMYPPYKSEVQSLIDFTVKWI